jgi:hypothetical protein
MNVYSLFGWYSLVLLIANALAVIALIGQPREPITPGIALGTVVLNTPIIIWAWMALHR